MVVESFHISRPFRRRGLGRRLFACALRQAGRQAAETLYISAANARETVDFYRATGCMPADPILPEDARQNLDDLRLCCPVDTLSRP